MKRDRLFDEIWAMKCVFPFSFFFSLIFIFSQSPSIFVFLFFIITDLGPKNMGPTPLHMREPNKSLLPNYVRGSTKPACFLQTCRFSVGIGFVIISDPFSLVWIFSTQNNLISSASRIQWYLTSICFDLEWKVGFLLRWIELWLSQ